MEPSTQVPWEEETIPISGEASRLRKLRLERDEAKEVFDEHDRRYKAAAYHLFQRMQDEEVESLKVEGISFIPSETIYANIQDREEFVAWAKENDEQLIEDKERKAVLNQLVRERIDNGEPLPPGVGFYIKETISQRAS